MISVCAKSEMCIHDESRTEDPDISCCFFIKKNGDDRHGLPFSVLHL